MKLLIEIWNNYIINVLDILVVSLIFYYLLVLIRGTRAVMVLRGILILFIATMIAQVLHYQAVKWILGKFWVAGIIAIVIVFQSELRTALANLGQTSLGRASFKEQMVFIDEIVKAVEVLKKKRCGALIVLEQKTGLRNYIESGMQVNGDLSAEILISIFQVTSPIHDGAVIIKVNKILAAGCILPLASELNIKKILGTRHRAAIGITEVSDACAIVVSEQSGRISLGYGKDFDSNMDIDKLRRKLVAIYRKD